MTTVYSQTLGSDSPGWDDFSVRHLVPVLAVGGTSLTIRFVANLLKPMVLRHVSVGISAGGPVTPLPDTTTVSTPIEALFSGAPGATIPGGATLVSDPVSLTYTTADQLVVIFDFTDDFPNATQEGSSSGNAKYYGQGDPQYNVTVDTGGTQYFDVGFDLIQVSQPPTSVSEAIALGDTVAASVVYAATISEAISLVDTVSNLIVVRPIFTDGSNVVLDLATGFTTGAPLIEGQPAVMLMNVANSPVGSLSLRFVKPDGSIVFKSSPYLYVGNVAMPALGPNFAAGQYVVYTFAPGELDQRGVWQVELTAGVTTFRTGYFTVH